jgi:transcriptional repressor NrdR
MSANNSDCPEASGRHLGGIGDVVLEKIGISVTVMKLKWSAGQATTIRDMFCPTCRATETKVVDSRLAEEGSSIRRRRQCLTCAARFTTYERVDEVPLVVVKSSGLRTAFDRSKIESGIMAASKGRAVSVEQVQQLAMAVEDEVRLLGGEVTTAQIGIAVLERLRSLDEVAYLRFASVYKDFDAAADFHREIELLSKMASST